MSEFWKTVRHLTASGIDGYMRDQELARQQHENTLRTPAATALNVRVDQVEDWTPRGYAQRLITGLRDHHPDRLRALHSLLAAASPADMDDALADPYRYTPPTAAARPPEAAPWSSDPEDCPACGEIQDLCRYHTGLETGWREGAALIARALTDPHLGIVSGNETHLPAIRRLVQVLSDPAALDDLAEAAGEPAGI